MQFDVTSSKLVYRRHNIIFNLQVYAGVNLAKFYGSSIHMCSAMMLGGFSGSVMKRKFTLYFFGFNRSIVLEIPDIFRVIVAESAG